MQWGHLTVAEPATMLTDYAVAAAFALSSLLLVRQQRGLLPSSRQQGTLWWAASFSMLAISFACAGTEHGFAVYTLCESGPCKFCSPLWLVSMMLAVGAVGVMVLAYAARDFDHFRTRASKTAALPAFLVPAYCITLLVGEAAQNNEMRSFLAMVGFLLPLVGQLCFLCYTSIGRSKTAFGNTHSVAAEVSVGRGLALVGVAQLWNMPKIHPSRWFNANDVSHTVVFLAVPLLYRGAAGIQDWPRTASREPNKILELQSP